jgi:hypothetical protein
MRTSQVLTHPRRVSALSPSGGTTSVSSYSRGTAAPFTYTQPPQTRRRPSHSRPHQEEPASPLRSGCPSGPNIRLPLGPIALPRWFCQVRFRPHTSPHLRLTAPQEGSTGVPPVYATDQATSPVPSLQLHQCPSVVQKSYPRPSPNPRLTTRFLKLNP